MSPKQVVSLVSAVILCALVLMSSKSLVQVVDAGEVCVIQSVMSGDLSWYTEPGPKPQMFGKVTCYPKREMYEINNKLRFNDGAHASMAGSIQYEMPNDEQNLTRIHTRFSSPEGLKASLVKPVVDKVVYMTGPLMSSKESYAERRNELITAVEDQVENGVYQTRQYDHIVTDETTGEQKTITVVEIRRKDGLPLRAESPQLTQFGIRPFNFSIVSLDYVDMVEKQIATQQQATMAVQTAMANAKKAEQVERTLEAEGRAMAAQAKWAQETEKAREVTRAEQIKAVAELEAQKQLEVARLHAQAAKEYEKEQIARANADATYKREVMEADGALAEKLQAWVQVNSNYALAMQNHPHSWVPSVVMGSMGSEGGNPAMDMMSMIAAKTAKDLALDAGFKR